MFRTRPMVVPVIAGITLLTAACGGATPSSSSSKPSAPQASSSGQSSASKSKAPAKKSLTPVKFLLDWQVEGYQAPFYLAAKNGDFKAAGLKVTIVPGHGSGSTTDQVAHGNYPLGFADAARASAAISKGEPVKVVASFFQKSPVAVIFKASQHITKPSDLIGKKIGTSAGSASDKLFNAFLAANHMTKKQVHLEYMSSSAKVGALEANKVDAILNYTIDTIPVLDVKGMHVKALPFGDWGVGALSTSVIVNDTFLKQHPQEVRGFVKAAQKAWAAAEKNPKSAITAEKSMASNVPTNAIGELKLAFDLLHTNNSQGHPLGWMSPKDWTTTLNILHRYLGVKDIKSPSTYYTDKFAG